MRVFGCSASLREASRGGVRAGAAKRAPPGVCSLGQCPVLEPQGSGSAGLAAEATHQSGAAVRAPPTPVTLSARMPAAPCSRGCRAGRRRRRGPDSASHRPRHRCAWGHDTRALAPPPARGDAWAVPSVEGGGAELAAGPGEASAADTPPLFLRGHSLTPTHVVEHVPHRRRRPSKVRPYILWVSANHGVRRPPPGCARPARSSTT